MRISVSLSKPEDTARGMRMNKHIQRFSSQTPDTSNFSQQISDQNSSHQRSSLRLRAWFGRAQARNTRRMMKYQCLQDLLRPKCAIGCAKCPMDMQNKECSTSLYVSVCLGLESMALIVADDTVVYDETAQQRHKHAQFGTSGCWRTPPFRFS